ncbi:MAG: hypothetical protein NVS2B5_05720 [Beijerinckiaceae bacterium]
MEHQKYDYRDTTDTAVGWIMERCRVSEPSARVIAELAGLKASAGPPIGPLVGTALRVTEDQQP